MHRSHGYVVIMAAWVLWQELLVPQTSRFPSWHVEGRFSEEGACQEMRNIRLIELMLRAGSDGTTIINQPTLEEGMVWRQEPNGDRTRIRFLCFPETINPEAPWFGRQRRDRSLRFAAGEAVAGRWPYRITSGNARQATYREMYPQSAPPKGHTPNKITTVPARLGHAAVRSRRGSALSSVRGRVCWRRAFIGHPLLSSCDVRRGGRGGLFCGHSEPGAGVRTVGRPNHLRHVGFDDAVRGWRSIHVLIAFSMTSSSSSGG
jgi:hypothetical protein